MKDFKVIHSPALNQSLLILKNSDVSYWSPLSVEVEGGYDEKGTLIQIKTKKMIKIIPLTTQSKIQKQALTLVIGGDKNFSYLYLNPELAHKDTKLQDKGFYSGLNVFIDFSKEGKVIGLEFSAHPQVLYGGVQE